MTVVEPRADACTIGLRTHGSAMILHGRSGRDEMSGPHTGLVYREREDLRVAISDDHAGSSFELLYARIVQVLEELIERPVSRRIEFEPFFDTRADAGGQLGRVANFIGGELLAPRGTALESWDRTLEDLLIRSLLLLQPHSYSASMAGPVTGAAPYNVKRAKAFMWPHGGSRGAVIEAIISIDLASNKSRTTRSSA